MKKEPESKDTKPSPNQLRISEYSRTRRNSKQTKIERQGPGGKKWQKPGALPKCRSNHKLHLNIIRHAYGRRRIADLRQLMNAVCRVDRAGQPPADLVERAFRRPVLNLNAIAEPLDLP